ncbi:MAG TPA: TonB-dependent receptor [Bryobacteraceae bacterium]|jgi:hypothetical protein|nr:TonB-dependent receptor [Bryobacteraceae bacterium]
MRAQRSALLLFVAVPLLAQVDRANLNGTVTDSSGALVPGAKVLAVSRETGLKRETVTGSSGAYSLPALPAGVYDLTISHAGFRAFSVQGIELFVGQTRTIDARLDIGPVNAEVNVQAGVETLERDDAQIGAVIETQQLRDIPVNGRNWATLMMLAPGAINTGGGDQRSIRFEGRARDDNNYMFDGIDASGVQEQPQKADARLNISLESIAEFRVNSAVYTAETGAAGGAQINAISRSGSNAFHGGAFDYLRNSAFDARSPFDPSTLPAFRMNQFGGRLGGPIVKDSSFFFVNYEGIRQSLGQTLIGFTPSAAFRSRVAATSPSLQAIINAYPVGQTPIDPNVDQLTVQTANTVREDSGMIRFDHHFTPKTTMFARYNVDDAFLDSPNGPTGSRTTTAIRPSNVVLELMHIFSPTVLNETKIGMNRSAYHHPTVGTVPVNVTEPDFSDLNAAALDEEVGTTFSYIDTLTVIRGRHTLKTGFDIRRIRLNNSGNAIDVASISYASLDDFVHNSVDSVSIDAALGIGGMRRTFWAGFVQDDIKARPNLTVNLGLRYDYFSVMKEVKDRIAVVDVAGCHGFCPPGTPMYSPDRNNFEPRVGLAWSPARLNGNTVIRTGFGIYYGGNQNDDFSDPHESTATRLSLSSADIPTLTYPYTPFLAQLQSQGVSPKGIDRNRRDLYYENWDFMIQQKLTHGFTGQVGYVGSEGHHLFTLRAVNLLDPITRKRPLAQFGPFNVKYNDGNSSFHALQASLQRIFTSGFLWQTQYMWSHAITDASVGAGESVAIQNASCRACDRSDSPYDVRHTMTTNSIYQLPFGRGRRFLHDGGALAKVAGGWELSGIFTASTGRPINILVRRSAADMPDGNASNQRPDLAPGVPVYPAKQDIDHWLNPAAFKVPAKGAWGNLGRNVARGPGLWELDTAVEKRTRLIENLSISFRAEAFNVFNHPIFANPAANISALASFGRITSVLNTGAVGVGSPRKLQFMLRLDF